MPTKTDSQIHCRQCGGTGRQSMPEHFRETFGIVKRLRNATAESVANALKWEGSVNAMNNRLEAMREAGLLTRSKRGRNFFYVPAK